MTALERAILSTLSWFDLWRQPLTTFECWYYLWDEDGAAVASKPGDIYSSLLNLLKLGAVKNERGFWQLASSPAYAAERLARARWSIPKRRRAQRAAKLIMSLPFIRWVALANTLAAEGAGPESDIDLLIVVQPGRLYLGRLLVTALTQLLGWRRHGRHVTNRICLSFYIAADNLNIKSLAYADDPYLIYWLASLYPLVNSSIEPELLQANSWIRAFIPHRFEVDNLVKGWLNSAENKGLARVTERALARGLGNVIEYWARQFQLYLIKRHRDSRLGDGSTAVVVNDSMLKFHESDQRPQLAASWRARQRQILADLSS